MKSQKKLSIILLDTDKTALEMMAQSEGEKMSVLIRRLLRQELRRRGFLPNEKNSLNNCKETLFELNRDVE